MVVYTHVPLFLWMVGTHDDGLFVELGRNLASGDWLGPYSQFTLMKGPGYPAFLAVGAWLGVKVSFMHALLHCLGVTAFAWVILRISKCRLLAGAVFLVTLWHPSMFVIGRILRANIYAPQTILLLAVFSYALFVAGQRNQRIKWGLLAGLILGWFWLTREEGVWILPGIGFLLLFEWVRKRSREAFKKTMESTLPMVAVCLFIVFGFSFVNWIVYDKFVGVDFKEKNFKAAISVLQSVRVGEPIPYLPLPRAARERVYEVSPSFATLKGYLDPPDGSPWQFSCGHYPWTCGDIAGVLMWWAIRAAADGKGFYETPEKASEFYGAITSEVKAACADGRLDCDQGGFLFLPVITGDQLREIPETVLTAIRRLIINPKGFDPVYQRSQGEKENFSKTLSFLNHPVHFPPVDMHKDIFPLSKKSGDWILIQGWYRDMKKGDEWFYMDVDCPDNFIPRSSMNRIKSKDIATHFQDPKSSAQRYAILTEYQSNCNFIFSSKKGAKLSLNMGEIARGTAKSWDIGSATFYIDLVNRDPFQLATVRKENDRKSKNKDKWIFIEGWYYDRNKGDEWFKANFVCPDNSKHLFRMDRTGSPDIVEYFNDPKALKQRFGILAKNYQDCLLSLSSSGLGKLSLTVEEIVATAPAPWQSGSATVFFDSALPSTFNSDVRVRTSYSIRSVIYEGYKTGFPLLIWVGFLSFLGGIPLMMKRRTWPVLFALASACWILIAARIALLVLITISSFPALRDPYLLPAYLLLCIAPILSIAAVVSITWNKSQPRSNSEPPPVATA